MKISMNPMSWIDNLINKRPEALKSGSGDRVNNEQVITRIIEQSNTRAKKDIKTWRTALTSAENVVNPRRLLLYNLYDELVLDNHLSGIVDHQIKAALKAEVIRVSNKTDGTEDLEKTEMFRKQWFNDLIDIYVDTALWGHSLVQMGNIVEGEFSGCELVPRRHVSPEFGLILVNQIDNTGIAYRDTPMMDWLIEIGTKKGLGLLNKAAPNILFKRNAFIAWSEYTDIFGMPVRVGKVVGRDKKDMDRMEGHLKDMGKSAYAVFQEGEEIKYIESTKGDAYNVYDKFIDRIDMQISKLLLGQTMTTDNGSSKSQGEVHERILENVINAFKTGFEALVNTSLFRVMNAQGMGFENFKFEFPERKDLDALWKRVHEALEYFDVEPQYIIDNFGIPVKVKEVTPPKTKPGDNPDPGKKKKLKGMNPIVKLHQSINELYQEHDCEHE